MWKILRQTGICIIIVFTFLLAKSVEVPQLNIGSEKIIQQMSKHYSVEEIMTNGSKAVKTIIVTPVTMTNNIISANKENKYGYPMDQVKEGSSGSVYAVGGGTVSVVGENQQIGKFVKVEHGEEAESIYGNLDNIQVKDLDKVKKGDIIGTFKNTGEKDFYYSFIKSK
ncbi:MAG: M23 family metallopeptidase [Anaerovoracaceae bacterium]